MSSGIIKKKYSISQKNIIIDIFYRIKLSVPFTEVCFKIPETFIYHTTRGINFKDTVLEFQKIMKREFKDAIKDLEMNNIKK
ncbi:MAG: hypothetical protein ACFFAH_17065 [Promethearchaeota archaeon]